MKCLGFIAITSLIVVSLQGCASVSSDMVRSQDQNAAPAQGKALVVFFRDTFIGAAIDSTLYEVGSDGSVNFLGIVTNKTKLGYQATPGDHMFMVQSEAADFAAAHLVAGKIYYVLVEPRMGIWKARFSLEPIHRAPGKYSLQAPDFNEWMKDTSFVETTPDAYDWYKDHKTDIQKNYDKYIKDWQTTDQGDRDQHTLQADDGN
jgi:hypothetical protein